MRGKLVTLCSGLNLRNKRDPWTVEEVITAVGVTSLKLRGNFVVVSEEEWFIIW